MDVETTMDVPYRSASGREAQTRREELVERVARVLSGRSSSYRAMTPVLE
jgi:hypothetical protein